VEICFNGGLVMKKLKVLVILVIIGAICFGIYKIYDESKEVDFKI